MLDMTAEEEPGSIRRTSVLKRSTATIGKLIHRIGAAGGADTETLHIFNDLAGNLFTYRGWEGPFCRGFS
jgi:hypothetical protein